MKLGMNFDEAFFREETICGFTVSMKQKKVWACELDLAYQLLSVCQKHQIKIIGFAGTLLGAARHHGFIPWDDDMDFCMLRPDFEKLLKIAETEFKEPYFLQTGLSDRSYFCGYARLRNSSTTGIITGHTKDYNCGIYIDIFVMDGYIEDSRLFSCQRKKLNRIEKLTHLSSKPDGNIQPVKKILRKAIFPITGNKKFYEVVNNCYQRELARYNNKTGRITMMTHNDDLLSRYWMQKSDFDHISSLPFCNISLPVPSDYDIVLNRIYGDYMKYPPVEERGEWHNGIIYFDPDLPYIEYFNRMELKKQR